jgi:4-hydroxyphenylacetate 3-monooxygenase
LFHAQGTGAADQYKSFVDTALSDYDLNGWTNDTWINAKEKVPANV